MKIVALHTDFRIYWPARWTAFRNYLNERGHSLDVIEIAGKGSHYAFSEIRSGDDSFWHILFPKKGPEELSGSTIKPELFKKLHEINPDIVIAGAIAFPSGALAVNWCQKKRKPIIIFDSAKIELVIRNRMVNYIKKAVYSGVDAVFYPAPDWISTGNFWGFSEEQMYFGVDVVDNGFWAKPRETNNDKENFFVVVGRQIAKKNHLDILKAYHKYLSLSDSKVCRLVIIGDGPEHDKITDYIANNCLNNFVTCLPFLSQEELAGVYQKAKALISSSSSETWGLVINEAMACGCPIIASKECGATDALVHDKVNGYSFSCGDLETLAYHMTKLTLLDEEQYQSMREASRQIISNWGLNRFCKGCYDAVQYVSQHPKRKTSLLARIIINHWNGRYRPI